MDAFIDNMLMRDRPMVLASRSMPKMGLIESNEGIPNKKIPMIRENTTIGEKSQKS